MVTFDPQSDMENGFLGQKGVGEGCTVVILTFLWALLMKQQAILNNSPFRLEGRNEGGEIKNKTPSQRKVSGL